MLSLCERLNWGSRDAAAAWIINSYWAQRYKSGLNLCQFAFYYDDTTLEP